MKNILCTGCVPGHTEAMKNKKYTAIDYKQQKIGFPTKSQNRTKPVFSLLNKTFYGRVLGLDYSSQYSCGFDWPPFTPDINPCN